MKLLPSLRQKKRYLSFQILLSGDKFSAKEVESTVNLALKDFLGQLGVAKAAPMFLKEKFDPENQKFVLKVNNQSVDQVKAALTLVKNIKDKKVIIKSLKVSGTLKGLQKQIR